MKRGFVFALLFAFLLITPLATAQDNIEDAADFAENVSQGIEDVRDAVEQERVDYLGAQWKEFLLRSPVLSAIDTGFSKLNYFFVIFMARSWSFSLGMLFVILMWVFTLISIERYLIWFNAIFMLREEWQRMLGSLALTVIISHLQVFNTISEIAIKLIFFEVSGIWSIILTIVFFVALFIYLKINQYWGHKIRAAKKENKRRAYENKIKQHEQYLEEVTRASTGT